MGGGGWRLEAAADGPWRVSLQGDGVKPAGVLLDEFGIAWEQKALSAHRQADALEAYITSAEKRGVQVFIAAAGLSAALKSRSVWPPAAPETGQGWAESDCRSRQII